MKSLFSFILSVLFYAILFIPVVNAIFNRFKSSDSALWVVYTVFAFATMSAICYKVISSWVEGVIES